MPAWLGATTLALGLVAAGANLMRRSAASQSPSTGGGLTTSIVVEPFMPLDTAPKTWAPELFADSLVAQLARVRGLSAHRTRTEPRTDFTLQGDVRLRDKRLVIAVRLMHRSEDVPVWTSTFWRSESPSRTVIEDVAAGVVEAMYADLTRRMMTTKEKP